MVYPDHVSRYRKKYTHNTKEDLHCIFAQCVVFLSKIWHIYAFQMFLNKKKTHFECINKPKIILSLQYFDFGHTKLPYPLSNKKRYLWLQQARPNRIISSLQLPDILIFTRKRLFCNTIKLTFLCNIHCTVIFTAIK